ncbi:MAG: MaoC family dehydratase [Deltaproteobacteria bacterium]|nr:MaoC family dehydratase [Deltaproteobacteria bacterium]
MFNFDRRAFLKLMGQGTAALGMGFSLNSLTACAKQESVSESTEGKYQIFYPGEYLDFEKEAIEERFELAAKEPEGVLQTTEPVKQYDLLAFNRRWDPFNPLFNDKDYAQKAGYPNVPGWPDYIFMQAGPDLKIWPNLVQADCFYVSHGPDDRRFYTPVFEGDVFTIEPEKPVFEDITVPGSDLRHFKIVVSSKMYNQKGELAVWGSTVFRNAYRKIIDKSSPPVTHDTLTTPAHYTTDEEWEYIKELWNKEYIRGSQKLYWEDVNVGDEPTWVCSGAISPMDMVGWYGGFQQYAPWSVREKLLRGESMYRDRFGQYMVGEARHIFNMNNPDYRMLFYNDTPAKIITRMVTNYIGDAGLVTRIGWEFMQLTEEMQLARPGGEYLDKVPYMKGKGCTEHGGEGDTVVAKGYVTDKYINDKGEGIIDLVCWGETLDKGKIIELCPASARLPLKKG